MDWTAAESALRAHIETQWAASAYADVQLVWENELPADGDNYAAVNIEGTFAEKTIFGSVGKRSSVEGGIIFFHHFVPLGTGKSVALARVVAMTAMLELQTVSSVIKLDGGNPPTPVGHGDDLMPSGQPGGNYYRCSGSVPFILIGTR